MDRALDQHDFVIDFRLASSFARHWRNTNHIIAFVQMLSICLKSRKQTLAELMPQNALKIFCAEDAKTLTK